MKLYGGLEAGGTKFVCVVGKGPKDLEEETRFPTTDPEETLGRVIEFFSQGSGGQPLAAIGIGTFGPVDLDPNSPTYGYITSTPKPGWSQTDMAGKIEKALGVPVAFDTDVNAAAVGEQTWGAAQGVDPLLYLTIGTGIGMGGIYNGKPMHGLVHPESGHMRLPHDRKADPYEGNCPYHGDCFEGLACGPAMEERWGAPAENLPEDHPAWELEAHYIALALANLVCVLSPRQIVLGGGVMHQKKLLPLIRRKVSELLNGYVQSPAVQEEIDQFIVPPGLGDRVGVLGAVALAQHQYPRV